MPHSSGGGSHRGGSHHRSSHSSRSYRSGSTSAIRHRVRTSYFPGARRYAYMHNDRSEYVYADYDITKKRSPLRLLALIFYIPFIITLYHIAKDSILPQKKLSTDYNTAIVIKDNINVLCDTGKLKSSLEAFYNKTGISPAVFTVHNEDWQDNYNRLENYAYDLYVNAFLDEKHWLIVYSEPEGPNASFNDWYWEGMQGDDTSDILTEGKAYDFNKRLQRYLTDDSKSVSEAISLAFDEFTPEIMHNNFDPALLIILLSFLGFICIHAFFMVFYDPNRKYRNAQEIPLETSAEEPHEEKCPYCGAAYISGTTARCPNCQALLEIAEKK